VGRRVVKDQGFGWKKKEYAKLCLKFGWKRILKYANKRHIFIFICAEVIEKKWCTIPRTSEIFRKGWIALFISFKFHVRQK
jgi:hypothetical protein